VGDLRVYPSFVASDDPFFCIQFKSNPQTVDDKVILAELAVVEEAQSN